MKRSKSSAPKDEYGWEPVSQIVAEPNFPDLVRAQAAELGHLGLKPNPDFAGMQAQEALGRYRVWTMRRNRRLVGYARFHISLHPDYQVPFAFEVGHYIDPSVRDMWVWLRLWRGAEAALRALGIRYVAAHDNSRNPLSGGYRRLGYRPVSVTYLKEL